ncbi:hypothetical protein CMI48_01320 [Candidatus Pacearchaeota archaeon]|nr:hypothetical protein [Candidatus Pacearchaeota archaeon]|tara:strand:+ start:2725 stop:3129 length:405 start_codon:yes stop_codon:yes gene_type:complete
MTPNLKVLIGDDQIAKPDSPSRLNFEEDYGQLPVSFDHETDPQRVIKRANEEQYDAIVTDHDYKQDITGLDVLGAVNGLARVLVFHTGTETVQNQGFERGADYCIPKGLPPEDFYEILTGRSENFKDQGKLLSV